MPFDQLLSYHLTTGSFRGRLARLGPAIDTILSGHDYPPVVGQLLAETVAVAAVLAGALKYEGIFTLQAQGDGALSLLLADVGSDGGVRAYARFDAEALARAGSEPSLPRLMGRGYLAFTVDQGPDTERYQGIVELEGATLAECAQAYFQRSEQLETVVKLATHPPAGGQGWRAAALMLQVMPRPPGALDDEAAEDWRRNVILLGSATAAEMLDPELAPERLLFRLFHAEGLVVSERRDLAARCRCSADKVETALRRIGKAELDRLVAEQGAVSVTCEFCKRAYVYDQSAVDALVAIG